MENEIQMEDIFPFCCLKKGAKDKSCEYKNMYIIKKLNNKEKYNLEILDNVKAYY